MSLILEALRRSEAERRRGQAPDLRVENPPTPARRSTSVPVWVWWPFAGAVLLACAWLARGLWTASDTGEAAPTGVIAESRNGTLAGVSRDAQAGFASPAAPAVSAIASTPALQPERPVGALPPRDAPAAAVPVASSAASAPLARQDAAEPDTPPASPAPIVPPIVERPTAPPAALPAPTATATTTPQADAPLRLTDLSASERKQLPPLKISMHMWAQAPAQRFAIIDGVRTGEGDRVGDAVVEEITTDGVVLAWLGRRLKLSMR